MSSRVQRVLVIQDASRELSVHPIRWAVHGLSLQPGDKIKILRIVPPFRTTNNRSFLKGCGLLSGYDNRLQSSRTILRRQESIDKEISKKLDELETNDEMKNILVLVNAQQIEIEKDVEPGHSLKEATVHAANDFNATCLILDRKLRSDVKYIMENLVCGILRMKRDGGVKFVRAPKAPEPEEMPPYQFQASHIFVRQQPTIHQNAICHVCMDPRPSNENAREFTLGELQCATAGFSQQNLLSSNRTLIFRGVLNDSTKIAVKSHTLEITSDSEFKNRVQLLGKVRHENVALVLGSLSEGSGERFLVYEYVCNGSLNTLLSSGSIGLTWDRRMKIAIGSARGLQYLHSKSFYGTMRPDNILITHDYKPLLTNYGITRNQYEDSDRSSETRVLKTFDYVAPEHYEETVHSSKTDVYSFGVVLLELISGRKSLQYTGGKSLLAWARPLLREKNYGELIDPAVENCHDLVQLVWMVRITEKCLSINPYRRFSIDQVVNALSQIMHGCRVTDYSPPESEIVTN